MNKERIVAVFGSSTTEPGTPDWVDAESVGARCAAAGLAVVTGGYGGIMEAVSRGAAESGGRTIGVTAPTLFPARSGANQFVTEEIPAASLIERIGILTDLADGAVVLPGSIGTAAELMVSWNLNYINRLSGSERIPTVAVGEEWKTLNKLLRRETEDAEDVHVVHTAPEAVDWLLSQPEIR